MKRSISDIVSWLTLEEKAGLCSGRDFWHTKAVERLGIPSVMMTDGPHGLRKQKGSGDALGINDSIDAVCFPAACATASSFDPELVRVMGRTIGEECRAEDVFMILGPGANIKRSPLCGRNFEYYSEDPFLTGKMAAAFIKGVQEWDVGTSIKHFAANNQEYRRMSCSSNLSERTLREIYLPGFEEAVKQSKPWSVMCSYNRVNGTFAAENQHLLTEILRNEWGFEGFVVTDWGAINGRVAGLEAGTDLEMPGPSLGNEQKIIAAVQSGELEEAVLDRAVTRLLTKILAFVDAEHPEARFDRDADHLQAVHVAAESAVLLKNDGTLPLTPDRKVAYIGQFAEKPRYQGGGSSHINTSRVCAAIQAAERHGRDILFAKGFEVDQEDTNTELLSEAIRVARECEVAVIFAGLPDHYESEGFDRTHMRLPGCQNTLIEAVLAVQPRTVVVLHNGSPVECPWADRVAAVLEMYLGGEGVGEAADALLFGDVNPSGRLAETFPFQLEDNPSYLFFPGDGKTVEYAEGVYVGYRYYESKKMAVRWPFGHGLSYTTFAWSNTRLSSDTLDDQGTVTVSVDVTNTGTRAGKEVVQLYVQDFTGTTGRPAKELKGFGKIALQPGETGTVNMIIDRRSLCWYHEGIGDWYAAAGIYKLLISRSCHNVEAELSLTYQTAKALPMAIDENTCMGELLSNPRTAQVLAQMMAHSPMMNTSMDGLGMDQKMLQAIMDSVPLKSMRSFGSINDEQFGQMLEALRKASR